MTSGQWWSVEVTLSGDAGSVTCEALESFGARLAAHHATVSGSPVDGPPRCGARLSVEAESPKAAVAKAVDEVRAAAKHAGLPEWPAVHVDCMSEEEMDEIIVETAYVPDPALWEPGFKTRRNP